MAKKKLNVIGIVFACLALVGLILAIVGMCTPVASATVRDETVSHTLFDDIWETFAKMQEAADKANQNVTIPSRAFTIIAFVVTLVGLVVVIAHEVLALIGKDIKLVGLCGGALTAIGAILILVAGLVLAGQFNDLSKSDLYGAGVGIWLGFIGGLLAGAAGILSALKVGQK